MTESYTMKRVYLIISGDVQGVGYRSWMKREALLRNVTGWVRNREDETVEAVIEGGNDKVSEMIALCKKGPDVSWVDDVLTNEEEYEGEFVTFEVRM